MRITSGIYKGRLIQGPSGIRPTQDKVRKAIFDILGDIAGLSFLELYAGSGAVGLEAVSRGVSELSLVESNRLSLLAIRNNIASLKIKVCSLYPQEADLAIKAFWKEGRRFDIIFMDPPYHKRRAVQGAKEASWGPGGVSLAKKTLQNLEAYDILAPNGFIIVQHFKKDGLPDCEGALILCKQARYGDTALSFYKKG